MKRKLGTRITVRIKQRVKFHTPPPFVNATVFFGLFIFISIIFSVAKGQGAENIEAGQVIVKYKATNDQYPDTYLRQDAPMQPVTGADSLDSINQTLNVISATPIFRKTYVQDLRGVQATFMAEMEAVKKRFPNRSLRIP